MMMVLTEEMKRKIIRLSLGENPVESEDARLSASAPVFVSVSECRVTNPS